MKPHPVSPQLAAGGIAGALTALVLWFCDALIHIKVPEEIASALTIVIAGLVAYFFPQRNGRLNGSQPKAS